MLSARVAARAGLRNFAVPRSVAVGGLRTYAAAAQQDVRPPVALYGVDGTYANALVRSLSSNDGKRCLRAGLNCALSTDQTTNKKKRFMSPILTKGYK